MLVPANDALSILLDLDDEVTQDLMTPTVRKEVGEDLTDEEIEKRSGLNVPTDTETGSDTSEAGPGKKARAKDYRRSAESIALSIDFTFQTAVPIALNFKAFTVEERRILSKNRRIFERRKRSEDSGKSVAYEFFDESETNEELYHRWAAILEYCDDEMPLEDEELERNVDAWQRVLEFYEKEPGPWPHLLTTLTATYGKRITPIFAI